MVSDGCLIFVQANWPLEASMHGHFPFWLSSPVNNAYIVTLVLFLFIHTLYRIMAEALITHDFPMSQFEEVKLIN